MDLVLAQGQCPYFIAGLRVSSRAHEEFLKFCIRTSQILHSGAGGGVPRLHQVCSTPPRGSEVKEPESHQHSNSHFIPTRECFLNLLGLFHRL